MPRHVPIPDELAARPFSLSDGLAAGLTVQRMRGPDLVRPFHGSRVAAATPADLIGLCEAYARRAPDSHFFSHVTAALHWRIPLPRRLRSLAALDVAVAKPAALPRAARVRGHRLSDRAVHITERYGLRLIDAASAWCQLAAVLNHRDLVAAGDHLVLRPWIAGADRRPFVTLSELAARAAGYGAPGGRAARVAMADVREGAESRPESHLRLLLVDAGLPEPELIGRCSPHPVAASRASTCCTARIE